MNAPSYGDIIGTDDVFNVFPPRLVRQQAAHEFYDPCVLPFPTHPRVPAEVHGRTEEHTESKECETSVGEESDEEPSFFEQLHNFQHVLNKIINTSLKPNVVYLLVDEFIRQLEDMMDRTDIPPMVRSALQKRMDNVTDALSLLTQKKTKTIGMLAVQSLYRFIKALAT